MYCYHKHPVAKGVIGISLLALLLMIGIFSIEVQVYGQDVSVTLTPADETWYIVTLGRSARMRECPSVDCKSIAVIRNRTPIHVIGTSEGWAKIVLQDGRTGYVAGFLTSPILPTPTVSPSATPNSALANTASNSDPLPPPVGPTATYYLHIILPPPVTR